MFALSNLVKRFGGVQRGGFPEKPPSGASLYSVGAVDEFNLTVHVSDAGEVVVGL